MYDYVLYMHMHVVSFKNYDVCVHVCVHICVYACCVYMYMCVHVVCVYAAYVWAYGCIQTCSLIQRQYIHRMRIYTCNYVHVYSTHAGACVCACVLCVCIRVRMCVYSRMDTHATCFLELPFSPGAMTKYIPMTCLA